MPASNSVSYQHVDKAELRATILSLREKGMSYRQIGEQVGLHWTRVEQIEGR
jgi:hypothetical protein